MTAPLSPLSPLTARFVHRWFPKPDKQSHLGALLAKEVPPHP
jgi:hypothetical protein